MSKGEIIISTIYLVVIVFVAGSVLPPNIGHFKLLNAHFVGTRANLKKNKAEVLNYIHNETQNGGLQEQAAAIVASIDSTCNVAYNGIEQIRLSVVNDSVFRFADIKSELGTADSLQKMLAQTVNTLLTLVSVGDADYIKTKCAFTMEGELNTQLQGSYRKIFHHQPLQAKATLLTMLQEQLLYTENMVLLLQVRRYHIYHNGGFDTIHAVAIPLRIPIFEDDTASYLIGIFAFPRTTTINKVTSSSGVTVMNNGRNPVAEWSSIAHQPGLHSVQGTVSVLYREKYVMLPWSFQYMVGADACSVEIDAAKYCYRGVDNPLSISATGVANKDISLHVLGGKVHKITDGNYTINPNPTKHEVIVQVYTRQPSGAIAITRTFRLRIKDLPPPKTNIKGAINDSIDVRLFATAPLLQVVPFDTTYGLNYDIKQYELYFLKRSGQWFGPIAMTSTQLDTTPETAAIIDELTPGDKVIIAEVQVSNPSNNASPILASGCSVTLK